MSEFTDVKGTLSTLACAIVLCVGTTAQADDCWRSNGLVKIPCTLTPTPTIDAPKNTWVNAPSVNHDDICTTADGGYLAVIGYTLDDTEMIVEFTAKTHTEGTECPTGSKFVLPLKKVLSGILNGSHGTVELLESPSTHTYTSCQQQKLECFR